jgi:hypothetical protein
MENFLDTKAAAEYLHAQIPGESAKYWTARLNNLRRTDRAQPFELRFAKVKGKSGFYNRADLEQYVKFEQSRRLGKVKLSGRAAEALRAFGGFPQGRPFKGGSAYLLPPSETSSSVLVRLTIDEPLMVFAMTPEQAIEFGKDLVETAQAAQRINGTPNAPPAPPATVTTMADNADVLIQRMENK